MSYAWMKRADSFPLKIRILATNEERIVIKPEDIPESVAFTIIKTKCETENAIERPQKP